MTDEKQVRQIVREELDEQGRMTRRGVLGLLGGGAVAGALTGSASGAAQTDGNLSLADVTADTYRITDNRYGGPASARSQLESELGSSDAGAKFLGEDNGALYHWTGSSWELMESTSAAVNTKQIATAPNLKVAVIGDCHWRQSPRNGRSFVPKDELKTNLDIVIDEINDWGADIVVQMGDLTDSDDGYDLLQQNLQEATDYLENTGGNESSGLDMPIEYLIGNHETAYAGDGNLQEMHDILGFGATDDTYRIVRQNDISLALLNTAYKTENSPSEAHEIAPGTMDWLRNEVAAEPNPVWPMVHVPISPGDGGGYDSTDGEKEAAKILSGIGNVMGGCFAHSHHNLAFNSIREQLDHYGGRWLHVCTPNYLDNNPDAQPWLKLSIDGTGTWQAETSYADDVTQRPTEWGGHLGEYNESPGRAAFAANENSILYDFPRDYDYMQEFGTGSVTVANDKSEITIQSGATSGDNKRVIYNSALDTDIKLWKWEDRVLAFRTKIDWETSDANTNQTVWIVHGGSGTNRHFGFKADGSTLYGTVADGSAESTVEISNADITAPERDAILEAMIIPGERADFWFKNRYTRQRYAGESITTNVPGIAGEDAGANLDDVVRVEVETQEDAAKSVKLGQWERFSAHQGWFDMGH